MKACSRVLSPDLLVDQEFLNHVLERFTYQALATSDIAPLKNAAEEILALLSQELKLEE